MDEKSNDVKTDASSSDAADQGQENKTDVKQTIDTTANAMIDALVEGASTDNEEEKADSQVLEQNKTEGKDDESEVEQTKEDEVETKEETSEEEVKTDEKDQQKEHEDAVPYERFKDVNDKLNSYKPLAEEHSRLVNYCKQNNISPQLFQEGLEVLRLMNADPKAAVQKLEGLLGQLRVTSGQGLPADLQAELDEAKTEVEEGTMSKKRFDALENRLKETAKLRVDSQRQTMNHQQTLEQQQQNEQSQLMSTLANWSAQKQKQLPDFKPKSKDTDPDGLFEDFITRNTYLWSVNPPKSLQQAVQYADQALEYAQGLVKRYGTKPAAKKVMTSTGSTSRKSSNGAPKSLDDVVASIGEKHGYRL